MTESENQLLFLDVCSTALQSSCSRSSRISSSSSSTIVLVALSSLLLHPTHCCNNEPHTPCSEIQLFMAACKPATAAKELIR